VRRSLLNLTMRPGDRRGRAIPVVLLMVIVLLVIPAAPVLALAAQEGEPPPTEEPAFQPVEEPTAEVLPTDEPAPTDVPPTETPTVTPPTTPTMTPTLEPTDEPTPTPTMTPEPSATATRTPTPTSTPTATATPSPSPRARIAAASVSPGSGRISGCTLGGASDQLQPGQTLTTTCFYTRNLLEDGVEFQLQAPTSSLPGMASGWQVQLNANGVSTGWVSGSTTVRVPAGLFTSGFSFTYALRAPANAVATGAMVASTVSVYPCLILSNCSGSQSGSLTLSAGIAPLAADDMGMSCAPASPLSVPRTGSATFTCRVNALSGLNTSSLIVRSVKIPAAPTGWTVRTSPAGATGSDGTTTISPEQTLAAGGSWSFTVTLTPSCWPERPRCGPSPRKSRTRMAR